MRSEREKKLRKSPHPARVVRTELGIMVSRVAQELALQISPVRPRPKKKDIYPKKAACGTAYKR